MMMQRARDRTLKSLFVANAIITAGAEEAQSSFQAAGEELQRLKKEAAVPTKAAQRWPRARATVR